MEIHFENRETKGCIRVEDNGITLNIDRNTELYREIAAELEEGMKIFKSFKNPGIPGRIKTIKPYKTKEDILKMLRDFQEKLRIRHIACITKESDSDANIIEIDELRVRKLIGEESVIREFPDRYEYCMIKDYKQKYDDFHCDNIQMENVFIQLLTVQDQSIVCSIDFPKKEFDLAKMSYWISSRNVKIIGEHEECIEEAHSMIEGGRFKEVPIVIYRRGKKTIAVIKENLPEITESFMQGEVRVYTMNPKEITSTDKKPKIILNGEPIDYIPEIEIDLGKDLLVANGQIVVAEYVGDYYGCLGFFDEKGYDLPVAWIHDSKAKIYIDIHTEDDKKIVMVHHKYSIDINELF